MKVVIAASASLQKEIAKWIEYWNGQPECAVLDYPKPIALADFDQLYPEIHKNFFEAVTQADILFIANEQKNGVSGYVGAETFAELAFGVAQKLVYGKNLKIILAHQLNPSAVGYEEIIRWLKLGWIDQILE